MNYALPHFSVVCAGVLFEFVPGRVAIHVLLPTFSPPSLPWLPSPWSYAFSPRERVCDACVGLCSWVGLVVTPGRGDISLRWQGSVAPPVLTWNSLPDISLISLDDRSSGRRMGVYS